MYISSFLRFRGMTPSFGHGINTSYFILSLYSSWIARNWSFYQWVEHRYQTVQTSRIVKTKINRFRQLAKNLLQVQVDEHEFHIRMMFDEHRSSKQLIKKIRTRYLNQPVISAKTNKWSVKPFGKTSHVELQLFMNFQQDYQHKNIDVNFVQR